MARERETRLVYSTGGERENEDEAPRPEPARGGVRLWLDRRASGRVVTLVLGLPGDEAERRALGRALRAACGAGGTVKDGALELQGDHRAKVEAVLGGRGIPCKRAGG